MTGKIRTKEKAFTAEAVAALENVLGTQAADELTQKFDSLHQIARSEPREIKYKAPLTSIKKAKELKNAFNLARLLQNEIIPRPYFINRPEDVAVLLREDFRLCQREVLKAVLLTCSDEVIDIIKVGEGSVDRFSADLREIFAPAVTEKAAKIILAHNHPTGHCWPSEADILMTQKVKIAGRTLGIEVDDHLIFGETISQERSNWVSLKKRNLM